jgi:Putative Actinobacterial Holin-X, holin superfamily III
VHASSTEKQRPIGELVQSIIAEATLLIRQELRLAAAESKPKLARAGAGAGLLIVAAVFGFGAFGALTAALIISLALVVAPWLAALIVTLGYVLVCAVSARQGLATLKNAGSLVPTQTLQTIKEDAVALAHLAR